MFAFSLNASADDAKKIEVTDETFKCLTEMTPVRGFFVANLLGKLDDTLRVANSASGGRYPPGSVIQLVPTEVMVCHAAAKPQWDYICEKDHGCAPLPITTERIVAIQKADPRCKAQTSTANARAAGTD